MKRVLALFSLLFSALSIASGLSLATAQFNGCPSGFCSPVPAAAPSGCSQATTFIARTTYTGLDATNFTNLVCGLVTDGVITGDLSTTGCGAPLDIFQIYATSDSTNARLNICSTNYGAIAKAPNGLPPFIAYQGFQNQGGPESLDTQFNATTASSPNFVRNSAAFGVWDYTTGSTAFITVMGTTASGAAGESNLYVLFSDGNMYGRVNDNGTASGVANPGSRGFFITDRTNSTTIQNYKNGSQLGSNVTDSSVAPNNQSFIVLGASSTPSTDIISAMMLGSSFGASKNSLIYNRMRTYMTAVGVP